MLSRSIRSEIWSDELLIIIPDRRGSPLVVSVRFLYVASVWRPEKLKKVQFKPPWIKLSKDLIHVVQLRMLLLVYDHPVK